MMLMVCSVQYCTVHNICVSRKRDREAGAAEGDHSVWKSPLWRNLCAIMDEDLSSHQVIELQLFIGPLNADIGQYPTLRSTVRLLRYFPSIVDIQYFTKNSNDAMFCVAIQLFSSLVVTERSLWEMPLPLQGSVTGQCGECSQNLHKMVQK